MKLIAYDMNYMSTTIDIQNSRDRVFFSACKKEIASKMHSFISRLNISLKRDYGSALHITIIFMVLHIRIF